MSDANGPVSTHVEEQVAVIHLDDGKANALSHEVIDGLDAALTTAESDDAVTAVAIVGRDGKFSAGFHLPTMTAGPDAALPLLAAGAELALRVLAFPKPVVLGVTGHALAMGAILVMAADLRIGAAGPFKLGMPEVAIGMPVPRFAAELARDRLAPGHLVRSIQLAEIYDPEGAVEAGYLDRVVAPDQVEAEAVAAARGLGTELRIGAFRMTRSILRDDLVARMRQGLEADGATFTVEA